MRISGNPDIMEMKNSFNSIGEAIEDVQNGKLVIVVDDHDRENEGDLVIAAEKITPAMVNFMITEGKGLVCVPLSGERVDELGLRQMVEDNREPMKTAFTVSVDGNPRFGVTTGISPADRAKTIELLINPRSKKDDLVTPGHVFPLRLKAGGAHRGGGRPGQISRALSGGGDLRDHQRRRIDGAGAATLRIRQKTSVKDRDDRRPDLVSPETRKDGQTDFGHETANQIRRIHGLRLRRPFMRRASCRACQGRGQRQEKCSCPRPLGMPDRRRLPFSAL